MCVQESLIIQKSYNTSLMIQILSCVPAFTVSVVQQIVAMKDVTLTVEDTILTRQSKQ